MVTEFQTLDQYDFEWDNEKALMNERQHGLSFIDLLKSFLSEPHVDLADTRFDYGERRIARYCWLDDRLIVIVFTQRGETYRFISARRANRREQKAHAARKHH